MFLIFFLRFCHSLSVSTEYLSTSPKSSTARSKRFNVKPQQDPESFSLSMPIMGVNSEDINHLLEDNWCISFLWKQCDLTRADFHDANLKNANLRGGM